MGFSIKNFALDKEKEVEGVWFEIAQGAGVRVARISNPGFEEWMRKNTRVGKAQMNIVQSLQSGSDEDLEDAMREGVAEHILKDWRGFTDEAGNNVPFSKQKALEWITEYREFYRMVIQFATSYEEYRVKNIQAELGNS